MNDYITSPVERLDMLRVWTERAMYAFLIAFCTMALWLLMTVVYETYFNSPPVNISPVLIDIQQPLCPFDNIPIVNHLKIYQPTVLSIYVSVMDQDAVYNIPDTSKTLPPRLHPHPAEFDQRLDWLVPKLSAGSYVRVVAIRGHDNGQDPLFILTPFTVGENCNG